MKNRSRSGWTEDGIEGSMQMAQLNDAQRGVLVLGRPFRPKLYLSEGNRCSNF